MGQSQVCRRSDPGGDIGEPVVGTLRIVLQGLLGIGRDVSHASATSRPSTGSGSHYSLYPPAAGTSGSVTGIAQDFPEIRTRDQRACLQVEAELQEMRPTSASSDALRCRPANSPTRVARMIREYLLAAECDSTMWTPTRAIHQQYSDGQGHPHLPRSRQRRRWQGSRGLDDVVNVPMNHAHAARFEEGYMDVIDGLITSMTDEIEATTEQN